MHTILNSDYSIEYCHIYTNEGAGNEHIASIDTLNTIIGKLRKQAATYNLCVMVDDYSFPETSMEFDYDGLLKWLGDKQAVPHFLIQESSLVPAAGEVVEQLTDKRRQKSLRDYIQRKRYPCSLFIATWYLARLGKLRTISASEILPARQLINILPLRFEPFEAEARDILAATPYADVLQVITNEYIEADQEEI